MIQDSKSLLLATRPKLAASKESAISTGSTLLNLACSDNPAFAFFKGGYYYIVGDSTSGKTWVGLSVFAEAAQNPAFKKYRFIYDDVENGALMDIEHYFGKAVAQRMEAPAYKGEEAEMSDTIESFYYHLEDLINEKKPFIYVLDSQDALGSLASSDKFKEQKKAAETGKEQVGSYGDGKAKYHSEHLRHVLTGLRRTESILIVIGQTRDNLGMGFDTKTRSGGRALRFYANLEIWTSLGEKIKKNVRGLERTVGVNCLAEVKKNRVTGKIGKDRQVQIPIRYGLGIDDVSSCVDYLIEENEWVKVEVEPEPGKRIEKKRKEMFDATDLLFQGTRNEIIAYVEAESLEQKLRSAAARVWQAIEDACQPTRKRRYE